MKRTPAGETPLPQGTLTHEAGDLHRLLVDRVTEYAIFALDPNGIILSWNAGAERLKGYRPEEIIGRHFSIFYPAEDIAAGKTERELEIARAEGRVEDTGWRLRKDGTRFWANVLITALKDDDGKLVGFAKVTRDLTERRDTHQREIENAKRLAFEESERAAAERRSVELGALAEQLHSQTEELERQRLEAESANRVKSEFLAAMSHELRTPLNAISGYAQLMQLGISGPLTPEQSKQLERIQQSQQHLLGIINDILNFSRIEAGELKYDVARFSILDAVDAVVAMIAPQATQKGLTLRMAECPPELAASADRSKVEQILLNLLSNAVKFTGSGGEIAVYCSKSDGKVRIDVKDSGVGIPREHLETIFAPFAQVGRSLANPKEGAGLGLSISRDLARAMAGDLTVESGLGAGSTFTLELPRAT
ncbi:MAG: ATP-binding protein [Gemmatimonadota bacterium]|nr:ATP-binding protein [Gemmatimonadota bacterium]